MDVKEKLVELLYTAEELADKRCDSYPNCDSCPADNKRIDCMEWLKADCLLSLGVTVQEWISVKDRLPEAGEDVIVFGYWHEKFQPLMCYLSPHNKDSWFTTIAGQEVYAVTHWMPMPSPPKGE